MIMKIKQDDPQHRTLLNKHKIPNLTPFFFNDESGHYLRGATYATMFNLDKLIKFVILE